mgnify:CR=1 FL=1
MGLFSKIKKAFKKVVRGIGKVIKKVTKPITKVMKKVLKPFGKVFSKLGWVGTLALGVMFPGMGSMLGSWMSNITSFALKPFLAAGKAIAPNFTKFLGDMVSGLATRGKNVFNSITDVFKHGVNKIGQAFGFEAPVSQLSSTGQYFTTGGEGTLTDSFSNWVEGIKDRAMGRDPIVADADFTPDYRTASASASGPQVEVGAFEDIQPPSSSTTSTGYKSLMSPDPLIDQAAVTPSLDQFTETTASSRAVDTFSEPRGTPILDKIDETVGAVKSSKIGRGADYALKGYGAYSAVMGGPEMEEGFYNPNIGLANAGLTQVDQSNQALSSLQFSQPVLNPTDSFNTIAQNYMNGFGYALPSGPTNYFDYAMQIPGYGYTFDNYLYDSVNQYA